MSDFIFAFFDVVMFPVDPVNLNFEDNPVMIILSMVIIGMGVVDLFRRCFFGLFNIR